MSGRLLRGAALAVSLVVLACNASTPTKTSKSPKPKSSTAASASPAASGASPSASPSASASPGAKPSATPSGSSPKPSSSPSPAASTSPKASGSPGASATPSVKPSTSPSPSPTPSVQATPRAVSVSTLAGTGMAGHVDGAATATFGQPTALALSADGKKLYVAEAGNHCIRLVSLGTSISTSTYAGAATGSESGNADDDDPLQARFNQPSGLALATDGTLYVADTGNHRIRRIAPDGKVTTIAGAGSGMADDDGTAGLFNEPTGLALDGEGKKLYVADKGNHRIRTIDLVGGSFEVETFSGAGAGYINGKLADARYFSPVALAFDGKTLYVLEGGNHRVRRIEQSGDVTALTGPPDQMSPKGFADGPAASAKFDIGAGGGLAIAPGGEVLVGDGNNDRVRRIAGTTVFTLAGAVEVATGRGGFKEGDGLVARFTVPLGLAVAADGTVYVADQGNNRIRKLK